MSNNTISKIELPNGNVYDIVDAINFGKDDENDIISEKYLKLTGGILTGSLEIKNKLSILYGSGSDQVLFMVNRGELNLWHGSFGDSVTTDRTTDIIPGAINMFGYLCGMNITGTASYPGSEPGLVDIDNSSTRYRNGLIEIKDRNNAIWFKVNYEGMNFQGPVTFGDSLDIAGALSVGDAATTRTNLGITPENIGAAQHIKFASEDATATLIYNKIKDLPVQTTVAVYVPDTVAEVLTDGKLSVSAYGIMTNFGNSDTYPYRFLLSETNGQNMYGFSCAITGSEVTPGTVCQYSGTEI